MSDFAFNAVHIHLLLNHFLIILSIVGSLMIIYWFYRKNEETIHISLFIFLAIAIISIPVFLAWVEAIGTVSTLPGININALVTHESIATITFWLILILWFMSAVTLYVSRVNPEKNYKNWYYIVFVLSLIVVIATSLTGYYGWNIRHTEIHSVNP